MGAAPLYSYRCQAHAAHVSQSRTDPGRGFQVKGIEAFQVVSSWLGSGVARFWLLFRMRTSAVTLQGYRGTSPIGNCPPP